MELLILSLLISVVGGCIPQGFDGTGFVNIEGLRTCYQFNSTVSCGDVRTTPVMTPEVKKMTSIYGKNIQDAHFSLLSILLDSTCCIPKLNFMALKDGFGIFYDYYGNDVRFSLYSLPEDELSGNVKYGPHEESFYKNATLNCTDDFNTTFVKEFISNYPLQKTETSALALPLASYSELVNHAHIQESAKTDDGYSTLFVEVVEQGEIVIKSSDNVNDSITWVDTWKEKKVVSKLLTIVAIGILGLEAVVFMLSILIIALPEDEQEILESIGLLMSYDGIETRDVAVQAIPANSNQNTRQNPEQATPKSTSSSKSVPALSKNKKVQKKSRAKSTIGQMNKKISTMPMIQEDEVDVHMEEISSSNA